MRLEHAHRLSDGGALLADGHVDALDALAALVDHGVDGHGRLAGLAVADQQLALAAADRRHRVDGLDAGLEGLAHRLAADDARGLHLQAPTLLGRDRTLAVDGLAQCVDHPPQEGVAHRYGEDPTRGPDHLLLVEVVDVAQDDGADALLVEVERQAEGPVLKLEELVDGRLGQTGDPGDAVTHLHHPTDLLGPDGGRVLLDVALEGGGDLSMRRWSAQSSSCSLWSRAVWLGSRTPVRCSNSRFLPSSGLEVLPEPLEPATGAGVDLEVTDLHDGAANELGVDGHLRSTGAPAIRPRDSESRSCWASVDVVGGLDPGDPPAPGGRGLVDQPVQRTDDVSRSTGTDHVLDQADGGGRHLLRDEVAHHLTADAAREIGIREGVAEGCRGLDRPREAEERVLHLLEVVRRQLLVEGRRIATDAPPRGGSPEE